MICQILLKYCRVEMLLTIWSTCIMFVFHKLASAFLSLMRTREELTSYPGHSLFQKVEEDHDKVPNAGSLLRYPQQSFRGKRMGFYLILRRLKEEKFRVRPNPFPETMDALPPIQGFGESSEGRVILLCAHLPITKEF